MILDDSGDFNASDYPPNRNNVIITGDNNCGSWLGCGNMDGQTAHYIDSKIDDGLPDTGEVKGLGDWDWGGCVVADSYDLALQERHCKLAFFY